MSGERRELTLDDLTTTERSEVERTVLTIQQAQLNVALAEAQIEVAKQAVMVKAVKLVVLIKVDVEVGRSWGEVG